MKLIPVKSSNIKAVGFDNNELVIQFTHGAIYRYRKVPKEIYDGLFIAKSVGVYFHKHINKNYDYYKVD